MSFSEGETSACLGWPAADPAADPTAWIGPLLGSTLAPIEPREDWPQVSIVVPSHNGQKLLATLLSGLAGRTDYPALELVVVDNASTDGTADWLEAVAFPHPIQIVRNARNLSFSAACNIGADAADGELLLFLNNDVEPVEPGWLKRLVASHQATGAAMTGAILLDPSETSRLGRSGAVQHAGLGFEIKAGTLRPTLLGRGLDLVDVLGSDRPAAAVVAACAVVAKRTFASAQGFFERFRYGGEDVDHCLRLRAKGGAIHVSGQTVLIHRPLSTRRQSPDGARDVILSNQRLLMEIWGPLIRREYDADCRRGGTVWRLGDAAPVSPDDRLTFCVKASPGVTQGDVETVLADLRWSGAALRIGDDGPAWLMDDVVAHVGAPRRTPVAGRFNVLVTLGREVPAALSAKYDLVIDDASPQDLAARIAHALKASGGVRRLPTRGASSRHALRGAVLVLGMARTGSSALTNVLSLLGLDLGGTERLLGPMQDVNAKGFFEHYEIMRLNTAILRRLGGTWRDPPALEPGWEACEKLDDLREQARMVLERDFSADGPWGFKDPRTSLTLPFWRPMIGDAAFIVTHRDPLEIAASLARRDKLDLPQSVALWRRYVRGAILNSAGSRRIVVSFDRLLDARAETLDRLAAFLGVNGAARSLDALRAASQWIDRGLRHHSAAPEAIFLSDALTDADRAMILLLDRAATSGEADHDAALEEAARRLSAS